jgi:cell division protein FtsL
LSSYGWYDKLGVVKIPKSHIHQYREDSHRRVKSKGHAERAILLCFLAVARILRLYQIYLSDFIYSVTGNFLIKAKS